MVVSNKEKEKRNGPTAAPKLERRWHRVIHPAIGRFNQARRNRLWLAAGRRDGDGVRVGRRITGRRRDALERVRKRLVGRDRQGAGSEGHRIGDRFGAVAVDVGVVIH